MSVTGDTGQDSSAEKVLVIGGSGFIGTPLVRRLRDSGYGLKIFDIAPSETYEDLRFEGDVRDGAALRQAAEDCSVIYSLAAAHRDDVRPPSLYYDVNVGGAENTCTVASELGIDRIVFTSTVAVYGATERPVREDAPINPINDYGRSKAMAEEVFARWQHEEPKRSLVTVRPTVVFGEGNRGNVYNLIRRIARGRFLMVGSGCNRKSMAYVENVAAFLVFVLGAGPGLYYFNYADEPDFDMKDLVRLIKRTLGQPESMGLAIPYELGLGVATALDALSCISHRSSPISAVRVRKFCANTQFSAAKAVEAGFTSPFDLESALIRTIRAERANGNI